MDLRIALVVVASIVTACGGSTSPTGRTDGGAGTAGAGGGGGAGSGGAAGAGGGAGACNAACGTSRDCCLDHCVNLQNDPLNCGACGKQCSGGTYCTGGRCVTVPCQTTCGAGTTCCGGSCCSNGELCCDPQGPLDRGPSCEAPTNGTCAQGCAPLCVCASPDTPIATPAGERPIASLKVGDFVYSVDHGVMTVAPILRTNRTLVSGHRVVRAVLATGTVLEISPGHPTAEGRTFADLREGDVLDGVEVRSARLVPYAHDATYDILPDTDSGAYFAGGVLVGSTLATHTARVAKPTAPVEWMETTEGPRR